MLINKLVDENTEKKKLGIHDYSLINALLNKNREVELHSNFIYSMINPNSSHYCGNVFLKYFLEAIDESNFINLENAKVHKEKGKIDLLIEDGERVIIIENKLWAPDQKHQISRYIQYSIEEYLDKNYENLENKIHVVYLSEYKKIPSTKSQSCIGFEKLKNNSNYLIWRSKTEISLSNGYKLDLPEGTKIKFSRIKHSQNLVQWGEQSIKWLQSNKPNNVSRSLDYAFEEYALILKRLDTKKGWKKLMSLDEYMKGLPEKEEKEMYEFMCEANKSLVKYTSKKLWEELENIFPENKREIANVNGKDWKYLSEQNLTNWFKKKPTKEKYRDKAFKCKNNNTEYIFALGVNNCALGKAGNFKFAEHIIEDAENIIDARKNIFDLIEKIQNKISE